ncbi:uncharacterized protein LOC128553809, partial [Mercenaria mercenaria]|uniref:uncharacterized protein LOC128553809 n=1 Tax=Mercenaria mercenaria TaxID=6596 RepID=UPI00234F161C
MPTNILFVFVATVKGKPVTDIHQNIDNRNSGNRVQIRASRSETGTEMMKRDTSAAENNIELTTKMDRKKRQCSLSPFDVHCHGYCPKTNTRDWEKLIIYWNCSARYEGTTYHCARINTTGQFVEACAVPKNCDK